MSYKRNRNKKAWFARRRGKNGPLGSVFLMHKLIDRGLRLNANPEKWREKLYDPKGKRKVIKSSGLGRLIRERGTV